MMFFKSFKSEWLKTRRSLAFWMVMVGGFFTPAIIIAVRLIRYEHRPEIYAADGFWTTLWNSSWQSMAVFLLPLGAILSTSLITQLEYKNNTWKQLHTLPLSYTTIFVSKLAVIITLMLQFFVLFNIGIALAGLVPYLLVPGTPFPAEPVPYMFFLRENAYYFAGCLPIVALQYLISLQFKNFIVPMGIGIVLWIGALSSLSWKYGYLVPYTYTVYNHLKNAENARASTPEVSIYVMSLAYFAAFTIAGYVLYLLKREKG